MSSGRARFLRDNVFLVAATVLPLLVIGLFVLASAIPRWTVPPPAYDLVFRADGIYDINTSKVIVEYRVRDGRLEATVRPAPATAYGPSSALFLFDHSTLSAHEIVVDLPELSEKDAPQTITVPSLAGRRIVTDARAPDGYAFDSRYRNGGGIVGEIFGMSRYDARVSIVKDGRVVPVDLPARYRYPPSISTLGWIIEEPGR